MYELKSKEASHCQSYSLLYLNMSNTHRLKKILMHFFFVFLISFREGDILLQNRLLKSLLEVANQYATVSLATTFPASFLQPLLNMSVVRSSGKLSDSGVCIN